MTHYIQLVWYKAYADLRAEASRAYLGVLWWVLEPLLYLTVFYLVFSVLFQRGGEGFVTFLLCGLVTWRWFGSSVSRGANSLFSHSGLMLQVYLPKYLFPAIVLITNTLKFLIVLGLFLVYLLLLGPSLSWSWLALPILLFIQLLLIAACAGLLAAVMPFVPDLRIVIENALTLMFFMSGIFYDVGAFPEDTQFYFQLNPMATLIENYRFILLQGLWPDWQALGIVALASVLGIMAALYLLTYFDRRYPKVLLT